MNKLVTLIFSCLLLSVTSITHAKIPVMFGESDYFEKIESVNPVKLEENKPALHLASHTYIKWFIAGVYMKDKGYVLVNNAKNEYMSLTPEIIKELQADNLLPKEIPAYSVSMDQYLKGFSLWLIILAALLYFFIIKRPRSRPQE